MSKLHLVFGGIQRNQDRVSVERMRIVDDGVFVLLRSDAGQDDGSAGDEAAEIVDRVVAFGGIADDDGRAVAFQLFRELRNEREEQRGVALQDHRVRLAVGKAAEDRSGLGAEAAQKFGRRAETPT